MLVKMIYAKGWKKITIDDHGLKRGFLGMDSACRNQLGNGNEVENSSRPFFVIFSALWLNICNNSDQTLFSNALTFARSLRPWFSTSPLGHGKR